MPSYDLVGYDDEVLSGADDLDDVLGAYEIVGARRRAPARRAPARMPAPQAQQVLNRNAVVLREREGTKSRRLYSPLAATVVAAGAAAAPQATPQSIAFKPTRLVIPQTIAPDFTVDGIFVGNQPQAVNSGSAPAEAFVANAVDCDLDCDTVQSNQPLIVNVTNISGAQRTFRGTFFGRSVS